MRFLFTTAFLFAVLSTIASYAQTVNFEDGFEDGDFTANPTWSNDTGQYVVIDGVPNFLLQLLGDTDNGGVSSISTPSTEVEGSWEFFINLDFSPSDGNRTDVFLMSDIANLEGALNGYALRGGEGGSDDVFRIVRYDGGSEAATVLSGTTDISGGGEFRVRVTRQNGGIFTLKVGQGYGGALSQEGGTATDNTYTSTSFFGVRSTYTGSRADLFTYDFKIDLPPFTVTDATAEGNRVNVNFNRPYDQTTVQQGDFSVDNDVGSPASVTFPSATVVRLTYASELSSDAYILSVQNIQDQSGNALETGASGTFIVFDDFTNGDVIINEFMYDPPSDQPEYVELKNRSDKFLNLQNWQIGDNTNNGTISPDKLVLRPNDFLAVSSDTAALFNVYGARTYAESGNIPALNNGGDVVQVLTGAGSQVDSLRYAPEWGGDNVALERRSDTAPSFFMENFGDSPHPFGGTPGITNEVADDTTPPNLKDLIIAGNQTLDLDFSEQLDNSTATNADIYTLNNGISISNAQQTAGDSVRLSLSQPLQNGTQYQLTVSNQQDIFGNTAPDIDTTFTFFEITPADSGDIFVNEFMYDPPKESSEYIELSNPTDKSFDLQGWTINDNTGNLRTITNSCFVVPPESFVVLAPDNSLLNNNAGIMLVNMGNNFPSLNNNGDDIVLRDSTSERLDSLRYTSAFGGEEVALERRTTEIAPIQANFGDPPNGLGTPGRQNEIPEDTMPPALENLVIVNNQSLILEFSESPANGPASNTDNYTLDNGINITNAQPFSGDNVQLSLSSPLQNGTDYQLIVNNQQDVFGNTAAQINTSFTFFEVTPADSGDIFLNEFSYAPPQGSTEYIELFNPTDESFDLNGWTINDNTGNRRAIANSQFIVPPESYVVLAPDNTLQDSLPDIALVALGSNFPSLNNSGDDIVLHNATGQRLDSLQYTPAFGGNAIAVERRTIDLPPVEANFGDAPNGFGTPSRQNEIGQDTTPPELTNLSIPDNQNLTLIFTEGLEEGAATTTGNYALNNGISITNAQLTNRNTVRLSLDSPLQDNVDYQLTIRNQRDIFGNTAEAINSPFTFVEASQANPGDIFINEFTYDPPDGSTEYVELFNPTSRSFDLNGWTINDNTGNRRIITDGQFIVPPDSYVVLAPHNTLQDSLPDINLVTLGSGFPSLNNSGDDIVIRRADGTRLDSLTYTNAFGGNNVAVERRTIEAPPVQANFGDAPSGFGTPGRKNEIGDDTTPPGLTGLGITGKQTITLAFSEGLDEGPATAAENYSLNIDISIREARQTAADSVRLNLDSSLQNGVNYQLSISNQQDIFGNTAGAIDTTFTFFEISQADSGEIFINEFTYDPPTGSVEYVELVNTSSQSFDLNRWTINDNTGSRQTISNSRAVVPPNSFVVLSTDNTLLSDFPDINLVTMGSRFPSLNNSGDDIVIRRADGTRLDSLTYTTAFGGDILATERRTTDLPPFQANFGDSPNGFGTPGSANEIAPDEEPPILNALRTLNNTTIQLLFSESITGETATNASNYTITPNRDIQLISSVQDTVTLFLSQPLESEQLFQISIQNLRDIFGNTIADTTRDLTFVDFSGAQPRDIVINEILYSRSSAANPEFLELFNRTDQNFDLSGWVIGDASNTETFDAGIRLLAGDYLVATDNASLANSLENVILIPDLPSLNDDGDAVFIRTDTGTTIDSLVYNHNFGGTVNGTSAERIDPGGASNDASNFTTSTADNGSTPGEQNSVFARDKTSPAIVFSRIFPNGNIEVRFSEFITLTPDLTFTLADQPLTVDSFEPDNANAIFLNTPSGTAPGSEQTITARNLSDVSGNITASTQLAVAQPLSPGDMVINEILFDPLNDSDDNQPDQSEYIELRNIRDFAISLEGITLHDAPDEDGDVRTLTPVSTSSRFIPAQGTALIYAEDETPAFDESKVAQFFDIPSPAPNTILQVDRSSLSLASTDDAIYLTGGDGADIDSVFYDEGWHNPNLIDTDGIALERINPLGPANEDSNWGSSTADEGGTPNRENTLFQTSGEGLQDDVGISFSTNPFSPDDDGTDDNLLINYQLDESDFLITVRIYDRYGRLVRELADSEQAGFEGSLIWDGLKGDGSRNRIGFYIVIFEAFDSANGNNRTFKETVVLARRLN